MRKRTGGNTIKFGLIVPEEFHRHYNQHTFEISGLLNWAPVMGGDILMVTDDLTPYDVLMTNVSSTETEYVSVVRQENPDATIVVCFDYGFDIVGDYFSSLYRVDQIMRRADHIFSVNKNQLEWLRMKFPERTIHYVPHPTNIEQMLKFQKPKEERNLGVAAMWHQYDNYHIQSLEVLKAAERKLGRTFHKSLIGLKSGKMREMGLSIPATSIPVISKEHPDSKMWGKPIDPDLPKIVQQVPPGVGWDMAIPYMGVEMWYDTLSRMAVAVDLYTVNSIGRFGIDCAGVGVPCVASSWSDSSEILWRETRVDPHYPEAIVERIARLCTSDAFYDRVTKEARKHLDYYGFSKSKERMMKVLGSDS